MNEFDMQYLAEYVAEVSSEIEATVEVAEWNNAYHITINGRHKYASANRHEIEAYLAGYKNAIKDFKNNQI